MPRHTGSGAGRCSALPMYLPEVRPLQLRRWASPSWLSLPGSQPSGGGVGVGDQLALLMCPLAGACPIQTLIPVCYLAPHRSVAMMAQGLQPLDQDRIGGSQEEQGEEYGGARDPLHPLLSSQFSTAIGGLWPACLADLSPGPLPSPAPALSPRPTPATTAEVAMCWLRRDRRGGMREETAPSCLTVLPGRVFWAKRIALAKLYR